MTLYSEGYKYFFSASSPGSLINSTSSFQCVCARAVEKIGEPRMTLLNNIQSKQAWFDLARAAKMALVNVNSIRIIKLKILFCTDVVKLIQPYSWELYTAVYTIKLPPIDVYLREIDQFVPRGGSLLLF